MLWLGGAVLILILVTWSIVRRIERAYPRSGSFFETSDGTRLHYALKGTGNVDNGTLVMVHGASSNLLDFASSIGPELVGRYQVLLVDRPGLGHSSRHRGDWPDPGTQAGLIRELMESLDISAPVRRWISLQDWQRWCQSHV